MSFTTSLFILLFIATVRSVREPCPSRVFCYGPLLHTVQTAKVFDDSKSFVDMKMMYSENATLANFDALMEVTDGKPTKKQVRQFLQQNFLNGDELKTWRPQDYKDEPSFLKSVVDPVMRSFARDLVQTWPKLARIVRPEVKKEVEKYSFIPVPNGFIVPGGRFREYYYWDSYWIVKGLLVSEMDVTVRGILDNFFSLVKKFGFVPNGGRIYYLNRSDPPLLTKMALDYYTYTKDKMWLKASIQYLQKEIEFWMNNKTTTIKKNSTKYLVAYYNVENEGPRPESYLEDLKIAQYFTNSSDKDLFYSEIKSATESGWDFSSRWIVDQNGGNSHNLTHTHVREIVPVDLNSYLCDAFRTLSFLYAEIRDPDNSAYWNSMFLTWKQTVHDVFFDNSDGIWYDFNYKLQRSRKYFYPSNFAPLWAECVDEHMKKPLGRRALAYLQESGALDSPGGIAASGIQNGEQWDFPNAWAPLQAIVVQGLDRSGDPDAALEAKNAALRWLTANLKGFRDSGDMFEKYDALRPGRYGGGGEYIVQSGFGWTNGVALEFIYKYFCNTSEPNIP